MKPLFFGAGRALRSHFGWLSLDRSDPIIRVPPTIQVEFGRLSSNDPQDNNSYTAHRPSCSNAHASNEIQSLKDACSTKISPLKIKQPDEVKSPLSYAIKCPNCFDDTQLQISQCRCSGFMLVSAFKVLIRRRRLPEQSHPLNEVISGERSSPVDFDMKAGFA